MKKIIFSSAIALLVLVTACVKDKKFDDQKLGIPNVDVKGVSFPQSKDLLSASKPSDSISVGTDVNATASSQTNTLVVVALESEFTSPTDVNVSIALKPTLIPTGYATLPAGTYSIPATVKILAGQKTAKLVITFSNTTTYSLTSTYAIGLTLTGADGGFQVANNSKDLVAAFSVKNQYDGVYSFKGEAFRDQDPTLTGWFGGLGLERELATTSATSVIMDDLLAWGNGAGIGIGIPSLDINPVTNAVTWSSPGGAINLPGYNSRYVPATKTFYVACTWGGGPTSRRSIDTLVYLRPR
jgi:Domain of unknown function (DUF1735)